MKLYQRNGTYYVSQGKKKTSLFTDDEQTARLIYAEIVKSLVFSKLHLISQTVVPVSSPAANKKKKKSLPIEPAFNEYIDTCKLRKITKNSLDFKKYALKRMLEAGINFFSDVDQTHINTYCKLVSHYAADTQRKYFTELMAFLHAEIKKGAISEKRVNMLVVPKLKAKVRDLIIPEEDLQKIFDYSKRHDIDFYYYLLTLYNTFSRPGEVVRLKGSDFHLAERYVDIWQNKVQKTKHVYLYKEYCAEIAEWVAMKGGEALFIGAKSPNTEYYSKKLKDLLDKLNLNMKYTLYTFRHTSITNLMNKTNDVEFVARQAGHNNPTITMKHYINRSGQHYLDIMDK